MLSLLPLKAGTELLDRLQGLLHTWQRSTLDAILKRYHLQQYHNLFFHFIYLLIRPRIYLINLTSQFFL